LRPRQGTLAGVELMQMIRQGQLASGAEHGLTAAERFSSLAASSPAQQGLRHHSSKFAIDPGKIYIYYNLYHAMFEVRNGRIQAVREYLDTLHTQEVFEDQSRPTHAGSAVCP
jgi:uncharacterized protein